MKISTNIRFVLSMALSTLACLGLFMDIKGVAVLGSLAWLFAMGNSELTRPIPRNERWLTIILVAAFLAVMLATPFLHLAYPNAKIWNSSATPTTRHLIAVMLWIFSLWGINRQWQAERGKAVA